MYRQTCACASDLGDSSHVTFHLSRHDLAQGHVCHYGSNDVLKLFACVCYSSWIRSEPKCSVSGRPFWCQQPIGGPDRRARCDQQHAVSELDEYIVKRLSNVKEIVWRYSKYVALFDVQSYTPCLKKNCPKLFLSELRQSCTNFDTFWQKDSKKAKIIWGALIFHLT